MIVTVALADVPAGKPLAVRVGDQLTLAVCMVDGTYHVLDSRCPHRGAQLAEGVLDGSLIVCPLHHFKFNLQTGRCVMPKHLKLRRYAVAREGDTLRIDAAAPI